MHSRLRSLVAASAYPVCLSTKLSRPWALDQTLQLIPLDTSSLHRWKGSNRRLDSRNSVAKLKLRSVGYLRYHRIERLLSIAIHSATNGAYFMATEGWHLATFHLGFILQASLCKRTRHLNMCFTTIKAVLSMDQCDCPSGRLPLSWLLQLPS